jgi:hypothetical protein
MGTPTQHKQLPAEKTLEWLLANLENPHVTLETVVVKLRELKEKELELAADSYCEGILDLKEIIEARNVVLLADGYTTRKFGKIVPSDKEGNEPRTIITFADDPNA